MASFHIIYSSLGGNTEFVVKVVAQVLKESGNEVVVERCEQSKIPGIFESDCLVVAAPTYGHGEPDKRFAKFLEENKTLDLNNHPVALIGLGDSKYDDDYNMAILPRMMKFVKDGNGKQVHFPLAINKSPLPHIESKIIPWAEGLGELFEK